VALEMMVPLVKVLLHAHHKTLHAKNARLDLQDLLDPMDLPDHPDPMVSPAHLDKEEAKDHPDLLDLLAIPDPLANLVPLDNLVNPDKMEFDRQAHLARKDHLDHPDHLDLEDPMAIQASLVDKDHLGLQANLGSLAIQEATANPDKRDRMACLAPTLPIVRAHRAPVSSSPVNRWMVEQIEFHIHLFILLFKVKKDSVKDGSRIK